MGASRKPDSAEIMIPVAGESGSLVEAGDHDPFVKNA